MTAGGRSDLAARFRGAAPRENRFAFPRRVPHIMHMSDDTIEAAIATLEDEFALFSDWEERFAYLIDLGRALAPLEQMERNEANKVRGCASQVWLVSEQRDGRLYFRGESDAFLVKGLIAVLLAVFSGRTPQEILSIDPKALAARLGLSDALTSQRSNGLFSMMERIRREAANV